MSFGPTRSIGLLLPALLLVACSGGEPAPFLTEQAAWRAARDAEMRSPESWLTIAGLFWLEPGETPFGSDPTLPIVLPESSAPARAGVFVRRGRSVLLRPAPGAVIRLKGTVVTGERTMESDRSGLELDTLELGELRLWIIERGDRIAVRLRDLAAPRFRVYAGLDYFPARTRWRFKAAFLPYDPPRTVTVATEIGTPTEYISPGYLTFTVDGHELTLDAFAPGGDPRELFIIFRDGTSGQETYGPGRFLYARRLEDGTVDLDFNKAFNPPCAFTPFATCPLPPPQNVLEVRIEAGEKAYAGKEELW